MSETALLFSKSAFIVSNIFGILMAIIAYKDNNTPKLLSIPLGYIVGFCTSVLVCTFFVGVYIIGKALFS